MDKITLSLSPNYVRHWTIYDALRELYQNAIDRENEDSSAFITISVSEEEPIVNLFLGNANTMLDKRTLLLGETSKADNKDAIGNFGEGYKLAILVLLRNGIDVKVFNDTETWTFTLEHNEQFGTKMLTVEITEGECNGAVEFALYNLPKKAWSSYSQYNLRLQPEYGHIDTTDCEVLTDDRNRSKIFVGGLFVNDYKGTSLYGYNFAPHVFPLGRDRNIIEGFNANWQASKALVEATIDNLDVLENVVMSHETSDTEHMSNFINTSEVMMDAVWNNFEKEFPDTIPIAYSGDKYDLAKEYDMSNIKTADVSYKTSALLKNTPQYTKLLESLETREPAKTPTEVVEEFLYEYQDKMSSELIALYTNQLIVKAEDWKLED